jgi:hypothetical protein
MSMSLRVDGMNGSRPGIQQKRSKVDQVNLFCDTCSEEGQTERQGDKKVKDERTWQPL